MKVVRLCMIIFTLFFLTTTAWSAALTPGDVQGFVGSMRELKAVFDQYVDEIGDDGDATSTSQLVNDWAQSLRTRADVLKILSRFGFQFENWLVVCQRATTAYTAIKLGQGGEDVLGQMRQSLEDLQNDPEIPEEQKAQMQAQMEASMAEIEEIMNAPQADQDMVRPFIMDLDQIFDWQE